MDTSSTPDNTPETSRKRRRLDGSDLSEGDSHEWVRDAEFYMEDGDCVILVEKTLFKVHRFLLARDSSAFVDMFSVPQEPNLSGEGRSDDNPIILHGERVLAFKTLFRVLYALPSELQEYECKRNFWKLLNAAEMANKYHFTSITTWAVGLIRSATGCTEKLREEPVRRSLLWWGRPYIMKRIIEISSLCGDGELREHIFWYWERLIHHRFTHPLHGLEVGEQHGSARFTGLCYYRLLLDCNDKLELKTNTTHMLLDKAIARYDPAGPSLTAAHKARLLSGALSLHSLWNEIRSNPPSCKHSEECVYRAEVCKSTWDAAWARAISAAHQEQGFLPRVVDQLSSVLHTLSADSRLSIGRTPAACIEASLDGVRSLLSKVEEELVTHFVDLTKAEEEMVVASD